jgi:L-threonylcarbamoyladenylate synthase
MSSGDWGVTTQPDFSSNQQTRYISAIDQEAIRETAVALQQGHLVVFPTDTVYGVGVHAWNDTAIRQLYVVKQRPLAKGIPILLADPEDLAKVAAHIPPLAQEHITQFWPGPLTIIVPRHLALPPSISPNEGVALRIPDHPVARALIRAAGGALATSSANRSNHPPALNGRDALAELGGLVAVVLDDGPTPGDRPSTIISYLSGDPVVVREGPIPAAALLPSLTGRASL